MPSGKAAVRDQIGFAYMLVGDTPVSNTDPYATKPTTPDDRVDHVGPHMMILIPDKALARHPLCPHHDPARESRALKWFLHRAFRGPCTAISTATPFAVGRTH